MAARGFGGKTFMMAVLAFTEALTLRADVTLLGGSGEQSLRVHEYLRDFWKKPAAPISALATDPAARRSRYVWGNKVDALMASRASVSGPHPQKLRCDEIDLMDIGLLDQALGQPMAKNGIEAHVLLSSARYVSGGTMDTILARAADRNFGVFQWCWRECLEPHGWIPESEIVRQRNLVTSAMWAIQYDLQEPSPEGRAIDQEKVDRMFMGPEIASTTKDGEMPYAEYEPPVPGASYAHGGDWARTRDFVEIVTFRDDVTPMRLVAYQRFRRRPTPYIVARWEEQTTRYPGQGAHDSTSLGGKIMDDLINAEGSETTYEGVEMTGRRRQNLFTDYILAIEHEEIVSPRIAVLYQQHKFVRNDDLKPGGSGHPPDGFVAGAMAYKASDRQPLRLARSETPAQVVVTTETRATSDTPPELAVTRETTTAIDRALDFLKKPSS